MAGRELKLEEFDTVTDLANGPGCPDRWKAAIYNEAFDGIIEENIEDYTRAVKILISTGSRHRLNRKIPNVEEPFNVYISGIDVSRPDHDQQPERRQYIMTVNPIQEDPSDHHAPGFLRDDPRHLRRSEGQADPCRHLRRRRFHGDTGTTLRY